MILQLKYWLGAILLSPLLPLLYFQAKNLLKKFPRLPAAKNPNGLVEIRDSERPYKALIIGESTMAGLGVDFHKNGFAGKFAQLLAKQSGQTIAWEVVAASGLTAQRLNKEYIDKLPVNAPDLILIGLGANDIFALHSPGRWLKDMEDLIISLATKYPNSKLVLLHLPPVESFPGITGTMRFVFGNLINLYHPQNQKLAATFENLYYVEERMDIKKWIADIGENGNVEDYFSDGVHPNGKSYETWAKAAVEFVIRMPQIFTKYM